MEFVSKQSSSDHNQNYDILLNDDGAYETHVLNVINSVVKKHTYHLAAKNQVLDKIMSACQIEDTYGKGSH